jgi:IS30 family transposase
MASPNLGVKHLSEQEKGQIVAYKDSGLSDRDVAAKLNRHYATISSWYKKYGTI